MTITTEEQQALDIYAKSLAKDGVAVFMFRDKWYFMKESNEHNWDYSVASGVVMNNGEVTAKDVLDGGVFDGLALDAIMFAVSED